MGVHQGGHAVAAPIGGPRAAPDVGDLGMFRAFMGNNALRGPGHGRVDGLPFGIRIVVHRGGGGGGGDAGGGNDHPHAARGPPHNLWPGAGGLPVVFRVRGGEPLPAAVAGHRHAHAAVHGGAPHGNDEVPRDPRVLHAPPPPVRDRRMDLVEVLNDAIRAGRVDANMAAEYRRDVFGVDDDDDDDDNGSEFDDDWSHGFDAGDYDACSDVDVDDMDEP